MKLIIAGSRNYNDFEKLNRVANQLIEGNLKEGEELEIISGGANGADTLAEQYAESFGYKFTCYPANWIKHGKAAGPIRNEQMAKVGTHLLAFWDGRSPGTRSMIELAKKYNLVIGVVEI